MKDRKGEKLGWTLGWIGSFLWVLILSLIFIYQGEEKNGLLGLVIVVMALFFIFKRAPWRNPETEYWKLFLPLYNTIIISVIWAILAFKYQTHNDPNWWLLFILLPYLAPMFTMAKRKWIDGELISPSDENIKN